MDGRRSARTRIEVRRRCEREHTPTAATNDRIHVTSTDVGTHVPSCAISHLHSEAPRRTPLRGGGAAACPDLRLTQRRSSAWSSVSHSGWPRVRTVMRRGLTARRVPPTLCVNVFAKRLRIQIAMRPDRTKESPR